MRCSSFHLGSYSSDLHYYYRPQSKKWLDQPLEVGWDLNIIVKISCVLTKVYLPSAKTEVIQKNSIDKVFFNCGSQVIMTKVKDGKR